VTLLPGFRSNGFIAQPLTWLMLIAMAMGKYLMNGYEVFKVRPIHRHKAKNRRGAKNTLSPVSTLRADFFGVSF
jgi:hypothetical protein